MGGSEFETELYVQREASRAFDAPPIVAATVSGASLVQVQLGLDAVVNPVRIPPLDGIDGDAVEKNGEVQVVAARKAGLAADSDHLPALY